MSCSAISQVDIQRIIDYIECSFGYSSKLYKLANIILRDANNVKNTDDDVITIAMQLFDNNKKK